MDTLINVAPEPMCPEVKPNKKTCSVPGCVSKGARAAPGVVFHRYPIDSDRVKLWCKNMNIRYDIIRKDTRICSMHFEKEWYENSRRRLDRNIAIPTLIPSTYTDEQQKKVAAHPNYSLKAKIRDSPNQSYDNLPPLPPATLVAGHLPGHEGPLPSQLRFLEAPAPTRPMFQPPSQNDWQGLKLTANSQAEFDFVDVVQEHPKMTEFCVRCGLIFDTLALKEAHDCSKQTYKVVMTDKKKVEEKIDNPNQLQAQSNGTPRHQKAKKSVVMPESSESDTLPLPSKDSLEPSDCLPPPPKKAKARKSVRPSDQSTLNKDDSLLSANDEKLSLQNDLET